MFSQWIKLSAIASLVSNFYGFLLVASSTSAQIIPDNTLGNESSVVVPNQNIRGINSDRIDGGAVRGGNLFHSFQEFNVDVDRGVYFSNPDSIVNILTRVTGDNISNILGTLGVLGNANLFFINPNGIVFGPNARLDVGGSFFASTADGILFENGVEFAASNPEAPPLLTINIPLGLNIRENPGSIFNQTLSPVVDVNGNIPITPLGLYVPAEETIALIGGEVRFESGVIASPGSRIELGGLSEPGIVELNPDGRFSFPANTQRADVLLTDGALAGVVGDPGGNIGINARNLEISGGSQVINGVAEVSGLLSIEDGNNLDTAPSQAGDIRLNATESISLTGQNSAIGNQVFSNTTGNAGNIEIQTSLLSVRDGAQISTATLGNGDAGNLTVTANDVELVGTSADGQFSSGVFASVQPEATGNGGILTVNTQNLSVRDGAQISTATFGNGDAGNLTVTANDVELVGTSADGQFFSSGLGVFVAPGAIGNGGTLALNTQNLLIRDGAQISASTFGNGDGGNLTVTANDVELIGTSANGQFPRGLEAFVAPGAIGNGGTLTVNTQNLSVRDGAQISASTSGNGDGGNLTVTANDVELIGTSADGQFRSQLSASVNPGATGNGGTLAVNTQNLSVRDGAQILASTFANGDAGDLTVTANDVELIGTSADGLSSGLRASVQPGATGNGGTLALNTQNLRVRDGAQISTVTLDEGNAGNLTVTANDVELIGTSADGLPSGVFASVSFGATGNGGTLAVNTQNLSVRDGAQISTATLDEGNAGNLTVTANDVELIGTSANGRFPSGVFASVQPEATGNGGTLAVNTQNLSVRDGAQISTATLDEGNAGNLTVTANDVELIGTSANGQFPSGLRASVEPGAIGNGGTLALNTQNLSVQDGAEISSSTLGIGDAGSVNIQAEAIELRGTTANGELSSNLSAEVGSEAVGTGGTVTVNTGLLEVRDRANITVSSEGSGDPGNLQVSASNLRLDTQGSLSAESATGQGGNIGINTRDTRLLSESEISAIGSESSPTFEGNIEIDTNLLVLIEGSRIVTDASNPTGGSNITIRPLGGSELAVLQSQNTTIRAAGELSIDDTLNFDPPESLEVTVVDPAALIAQDPCKLRGDSEFIITGRGGLASSPNDIFTGDRTQVPLVEPVEPVRSSPNRSTSTQRPRTEPSQPRTSADIIPARGWIRDENGDVILVSYDPTKTGVCRQPQQYPNQCHSDE